MVVEACARLSVRLWRDSRFQYIWLRPKDLATMNHWESESFGKTAFEMSGSTSVQLAAVKCGI